MKIKIEPYTVHWDLNYKKLRAVYRQILQGMYVDIEHVGSTSVPGLAAKPIIDIDIIMEDASYLPVITEQLEKIGYQSQGTMGIPGRYAFVKEHPSLPFGNKESIFISHNLYVCEKDSIALKNHLLFRNYLRSNPDTVTDYAALKYNIAEQTTDIELYVAEKTDFIVGILYKCGLKEEVLQQIKSANTFVKRGLP